MEKIPNCYLLSPLVLALALPRSFVLLCIFVCILLIIIISVATLITNRYLLNAFKQCDKDMSGTLSKEEIEFCFGPKWLDLDVAQNDMDDFIEVALLY